jgi:t-SNARE complex subunit (syntaxin)
MQDRFADLQRFLGLAPAAPATNPPPDLEMGRLDTTAPSSSPFLGEFYAEVEALKAQIQAIEVKINEIDEKYNAELGAFSAEKAAALQGELETLVAWTNKESQAVASRLKTLAAQTAGAPGSPEARSREALQAALSKRFYELMAAYQELKARNQARFRERIRRHVEIATGETPTEEQVEEIAAGGDPNRLFAQKILQDRRHQDAQNALIFLRERHNDILKLERSIQELYQIFLDMALLVEQQGEMLDQIEFSVGKSQAYTEQAVKELVKANKAAKRARKKKCIIFLIFLCCIASVIIAVFVALAVQKVI